MSTSRFEVITLQQRLRPKPTLVSHSWSRPEKAIAHSSLALWLGGSVHPRTLVTAPHSHQQRLRFQRTGESPLHNSTFPLLNPTFQRQRTISLFPLLRNPTLCDLLPSVPLLLPPLPMAPLPALVVAHAPSAPTEGARQEWGKAGTPPSSAHGGLRPLSRRAVLQGSSAFAHCGAAPQAGSRRASGAALQASPLPQSSDPSPADPSSPGAPGEDPPSADARALELGRRRALLCAAATAAWPLLGPPSPAPPAAYARERRQRTDFTEGEYADAGNGLKVLDMEEGKGKTAEKGEQVKLHFEVKLGNFTVVTTRESKLLGGNRTISQPYEFVLGATPGSERRRATAENANGLFSAQAAPKPPKALYAAVEGMKVGGKRAVLVPAEQAYGEKGYNEIPPGAAVQLIIDLLEVTEPME